MFEVNPATRKVLTCALLVIAMIASGACNGDNSAGQPHILERLGEIPISSLVLKVDSGDYLRIRGQKRKLELDNGEESCLSSIVCQFEAQDLDIDAYLTIQIIDDWVLVSSRGTVQFEEFFKENHLIGFVVDDSEGHQSLNFAEDDEVR